jgi:hypothetical protein
MADTRFVRRPLLEIDYPNVATEADTRAVMRKHVHHQRHARPERLEPAEPPRPVTVTIGWRNGRPIPSSG